MPLVLLLLTGRAARARVDIPPADRMLATLRSEHPRLLVSDDDWRRIRAAVQRDEAPQGRWFRTLVGQADAILPQPVARYEIPDGLRLLATSRKVVYRTYRLAMAYRMTGAPKYRERLWRELQAVARFPDWNDKKHFLDTAEMTHAVAIGYDWLYDDWSEAQRDVLRGAIVRMGLRPALAVYENRSPHWGWHKTRHNWNQVCNGGVSIGALAVAESEPPLAASILHHAAHSITLAMEALAPDGACVEGPSYWGYATRYNVCYLAALESALGTDLGLASVPGLSKTGDFPIYMTGPLDTTFNFADSSDSRIAAAQLFWLARHFHRPWWASYQQSHAAPTVRDLIWYVSPRAIDQRPAAAAGASNIADVPRGARPLGKYFRRAEVVTMRSDWQDPRALFVGITAGDNRVNHSHLDAGSFVFDALGRRWVLDLGRDDYNLPGYFDFKEKRWHYYRMRAESHNTLVFQPDALPDQDPQGAGAMVRFEQKRGTQFAIADLTGAYRRHARSVRRGIALRGAEALLIQDEFTLRQPGEAWWFVHTRADVRVARDGRSARFEQQGEQMVVHLIEPADARFRVMPARPLASSPDPPQQDPNRGVRKLAVRLDGVAGGRIVVQMIPRQAGGELKVMAASEVVPLDQW